MAGDLAGIAAGYTRPRDISGPTSNATLDQPKEKTNGFGVLRLVFAFLVIVAHVPEMIDGNRSHELLTKLFNTTLSFGDLAVDGFFLISGYLVTGSFLADPRPVSYFRKRVLRIYPAFILCSFLLAWVIGPAVGSSLPPLRGFAGRLLILQEPMRGHAFAGLRYPTLDGSMWTLAYEFRCYLLAALFGGLGFYKRPGRYVLLTVAVALLSVATRPYEQASHGYWVTALFGTAGSDLRLLTPFMIGACFRLLRIRRNGRLAIVAAILALILLPIRSVGELALVSLGAYAMFWVALSLDWGRLAGWTAKTDISYGVYLYAWPITNLLLWWCPQLSRPVILLGTVLGAAMCGFASWKFVERPSMALGRRMTRLSAEAQTNAGGLSS